MWADELLVAFDRTDSLLWTCVAGQCWRCNDGSLVTNEAIDFKNDLPRSLRLVSMVYDRTRERKEDKNAEELFMDISIG